MDNRTKIIATIGPASNAPETIRRLIREGVDVFRVNFSHGDHGGHERSVAAIREASAELGREVGILGDLCGPKIRTGLLAAGSLDIRSGQSLRLIKENRAGGPDGVSISVPEILDDVDIGQPVLMDDGMLQFKVIGKDPAGITLEAGVDGLLLEKKGINFPATPLSVSAITEKDRGDLDFAIRHDFDFIALSFVRSAEEVRRLKRLIRDSGAELPVIAKIEKGEALSCIDEVIEESFGIMVARGDLGVELPIYKVPTIQKELIRKCQQAGKPVIVATQMLQSMVASKIPTRAEVTDIANAILDGADAVMLSGETATGKFPVEAVKVMVDISREAESHHYKLTSDRIKPRHINPAYRIADTIGHAAASAALDVKARLIACYTGSGNTALMISKYRPFQWILALTHSRKTRRRVTLFYGVRSFLTPKMEDFDAMALEAERIARSEGFIVPGENMIVTAGSKTGFFGISDTLKIQQVKPDPAPAT